MNTKHITAIAAGTLLAGTVYVASAAVIDGWLVEKAQPTLVGEQVAHGIKNNPGPEWLAPVGGLLQAIFWDEDPKCDETGATLLVAGSSYPVPDAPFHNGNCNDTVQGLFSSRTFDVQAGDTAHAQFGQDSGEYWLFHATYTPTPTDTPQPPDEATHTPTPTFTPTDTPTPTNTATATPTATDTPLPTETPTMTPTPKASVEPPEEPSVCLDAWTVPELPDAIGEDGIVVDIHVEARNPFGYTLFDGFGYLFFEEQPLVGITIYPERDYVVSVDGPVVFPDQPPDGCRIGAVPTGLEREEQPMPTLLMDYYIPNIRR